MKQTDGARVAAGPPSPERLDRTTAKAYSDGTPTAYTCYDSLASSAACGSGATVGLIDRMTGILTLTGSPATATLYSSFDNMGRTLSSQQFIGSAAYSFGYAYNKQGSLSWEQYPSGRSVATAFDTVNRVASVTDSTNVQYAGGFQYWGDGSPRQMSLGPALTEVDCLDYRLRSITRSTLLNGAALPACPAAASSISTLLALSNSWDGAGNLAAQSILISNPPTSYQNTYQQSFNYDAVNRVGSGAEGPQTVQKQGTVLSCGGSTNGWCEIFNFDQFGNMAVTSQTGSLLGGYSPLQPTSTGWFSSGTNRITQPTWVYDSAGNVKTDGAGNTMQYDAENRLLSFNGAAAEYVYDGSGNRVQKTVGSTTTNYVYDAQGRLAAEYSTAANTVHGGEFLSTDHLGSVRLITNSQGGVLDRHDLAPFGAELLRSDPGYSGSSSVNVKQEFTGKERDSESGLDYFGARYYGSSMGRMMSPDWSAKAEPVPYAKLDNPQSLNLYSYVLNNPLRFIDPDGHYELNASNCGDNAKCQKKYNKVADKFEKQRSKNLNSKNESIRNAAANYGAKGEANGVHVGFGDTKSAGNNGGVDISGSTPGNPNINVTLDFSRAGSSETITHEGTHVGDDQKFLNSFDPRTGGYDQTLNPTHFQTEFNAFKAGAMVNHEHGFGPNDVQGITNYINTNYPARLLPMPVFPVSMFPAGVPDE